MVERGRRERVDDSEWKVELGGDGGGGDGAAGGVCREYGLAEGRIGRGGCGGGGGSRWGRVGGGRVGGIADYRSQITDHRLQIADRRLQTGGGLGFSGGLQVQRDTGADTSGNDSESDETLVGEPPLARGAGGKRRGPAFGPGLFFGIFLTRGSGCESRGGAIC
jgi:hypothetical protein